MASTTTTNYNLPLYDSAFDGALYFRDFMDDVSGRDTTSAFNIIDEALKNNAIYYVSATGTDTYTATATNVKIYFNGMIMLLVVNNANTGNSTLQINALSVIELRKIDETGTTVQLSANDLQKNSPSFFRYDGTYFVRIAGGGGANLDSPEFTGTPTAPTATLGTNTTQIATTAFVATAMGSAGGAKVAHLRVQSGNVSGNEITMTTTSFSTVSEGAIVTVYFDFTPAFTGSMYLTVNSTRGMMRGYNDLNFYNTSKNILKYTTFTFVWDATYNHWVHVGTGGIHPTMVSATYTGNGTSSRTLDTGIPRPNFIFIYDETWANLIGFGSALGGGIQGIDSSRTNVSFSRSGSNITIGGTTSYNANGTVYRYVIFNGE